jgi:hypothetical protein
MQEVCLIVSPSTANTMPAYLMESGHMIFLLSALERAIGIQTCIISQQTAGGECETSTLLKKSVNLQYFAKFVSCRKGHQKLHKKHSSSTLARKKESANKSAPCSYWPLEHKTRSIIATQIRQTVSIYAVVYLVCCAFRKISYLK